MEQLLRRLPAIDRTKALKAAAIIATVAWMALMASVLPWAKHRTSYGDARSGCTGTFSQRYECTNANMLSGDQATFFAWTLNVAVMVGPPFALYLLARHHLRRRRA